jgi:hypothetical protein
MPPTLSWLPTDTVLSRAIDIRAEKIPPTPVIIKFTISGPDTSKFNAIPNFAINVVPSDAILIIAPSQSMTVYLKPGFNVRIGVMISEPSLGIMTVTPTWSGCPPGFANFSVSPLVFSPTSGQALYTNITGNVPRSSCALQFPLGGDTGPSLGTSNLFFVTTCSPWCANDVRTVFCFKHLQFQDCCETVFLAATVCKCVSDSCAHTLA